MREIKFRAWDSLRNRMLCPAMPTLHGGVMWEKGYNTVGDKYHVMQFTGLHDKTGKEIYEGDICDGEKETTLEIVWSGHHSWGCRVVRGGVLSVGLIFPLWHWDRCAQNDNRTLEIIGNIHENPELLKSPSGAEGK